MEYSRTPQQSDKMIQAQNAALSALKAFSTRVQSNGNNIANANTDGFKKTRVTLATAEPEGVKAVVEKVDTPGAEVFRENSDGGDTVELSNVELSQEIPEMITNSSLYTANLKTLQTTDEMMGTLLELKA